jgi:uncharacterized protein YkwD
MGRKSFSLVVSFTLAAVLAASASANTVPNWFWRWASWSMHGRHGVRPADAPAHIPGWSWRLLQVHEHHAKAAAAHVPAPAPPGPGHPGGAPAPPPPPAPAPPPPPAPAPPPPPAPAPPPPPAPAPAPPPPPAPAPAPPPPPPPAPSGLTAAEQALLAAVNSARAANGLAALSIDSRLEQAARDHTADLLANNVFTHDFIKAGTAYPFSTWIGWYYSGACAAENLALGQPSLDASSAVSLWLGSPGHRANLLSSSYRIVGVALQGQNGTSIATTDFGCS